MDLLARRRLIMFEKETPGPSPNILYYESTDGNTINFTITGAGISTVSNTYTDDGGVLVASGPIKKVVGPNLKIKSITLPKGLETIGNIQSPTGENAGTALLGDLTSVRTIEAYALSGWADTRELVFPSLITLSQSAFNGAMFSSFTAPLLKSIPAGLSWGRFCWSGAGIKIIDVRSCQSIGEYAIRTCTALHTIVLGGTVPTVGTGNFNSAPLKNIYVPDNVVDAYKSDNYWSAYSSIIKGYSQM